MMPTANALFVYGTLTPNRSNHHIMTPIAGGKWVSAYVFGELLPNGFGASLGYPAFIPADDGQKVHGFIFTSDELTNHWDRLDDFEGVGYDRVIITAYLQTGESVTAYVYALADRDLQNFKQQK